MYLVLVNTFCEHFMSLLYSIRREAMQNEGRDMTTRPPQLPIFALLKIRCSEGKYSSVGVRYIFYSTKYKQTADKYLNNAAHVTAV